MSCGWRCRRPAARARVQGRLLRRCAATRSAGLRRCSSSRNSDGRRSTVRRRSRTCLEHQCSPTRRPTATLHCRTRTLRGLRSATGRAAVSRHDGDVRTASATTVPLSWGAGNWLGSCCCPCQRDHRAVLASGRRLRFLSGSFHGNMRQAVLRQELGDDSVHRLPHLISVSIPRRTEANAECGRCRLGDLGERDAGDFIDFEDERRNGHLLTRLRGKGQHVGCASPHLNGRQRVPAWAGIRPLENAVAKVVT